MVPTKVELAAGIEGVRYEMEQFAVCVFMHRERHLFGRSVLNAALEGMLLHARVLNDFFATPRARRDASKLQGDDIVSEDFGFAPVVCLDAAVRERINKDLAHLTYASATRPKPLKGWDVADLVRVAEKCINLADQLLASHIEPSDAQRVISWETAKIEMKQVIQFASPNNIGATETMP